MILSSNEISPIAWVTRVASVASLAALLALATPCAAEEELPDARTLIDRHIEAIGGREAVMAQTSSVIKGRFEMPAAGLAGELMVASRPPSERVSIIELEGIGEIRSGYSPELAWSVDPFTGPRLLEGAEFQAQRDQSEPGAILRDPEYLASIETVEKSEFGGTECWRVRLEWKSGRQTHDCYAPDTGLMVANETTQPSPMGDVNLVTLFEDYRKMGGLLTPTRAVQRVMGQEQVLVIESVDLSEPDPELFELPAPIRTLVEDRAD